MSRTTSQLSQSMHEMYEIPDLNAYAEAMKDIDESMMDSCVHHKKTLPPEEDDDFVLLDLSASDRSIERTIKPRPIQVTTGSKPMMRRCSMSCARLPSEVDRQRKTFSLMTMAPDIYSTAIEEEEEEVEQQTVANDASAHKDVCLDKTLYNGQRMNETVRPSEDLTNSANRRPSRRAIQGGPLKSSLKSSLRTSQTSVASDFDDFHQDSMNMKRNVSFSNLEIHSYGITLGDQPSLTGPPISLDFSNHTSTEVHDIENYEQLRSVTPENPTPENPRRRIDELFIQPSDRQYLLMRDAGFSRMQIQMATEEAQRAAKERQKGAKRSVRLDEMLEKANGKFRVWQRRSSM
eukprot:scaffold387_cov136-Skeletonema_menzelii.AAC.14